MRTVTVRPSAKINLVLRVGPLRADGFHDVCTLLQSIDLADTLRFVARKGPLVFACDAPDVPSDDRNLVWRAARALWTAAGRPGDARDVAIHLTKQIPHAAGLGGGSADAAATLSALNRLWRLKWPVARLREVAATIGADVPFFLVGGTALGAGKGEDLYPVTDVRRLGLVIVKPEFGVGTGAAYGWVDQDRAAGWPATIEGGPRELKVGWASGPLVLANDLEAPVARRHPEIGRIIDSCRAAGADVAAMSGSGSAVFAVSAQARAARVARAVAGAGRRVWATHTLSRREALRRIGL